jgi:copper chaperone CopZ
MNKLMKFSFALLAVVFSLASCSETTAQSKAVTQEVVGNSEMTMTIEGMTCAMGCARAIEVELNNIEGVEAAKVDFKSANATLSYNGSLTSESSIVDFVNNYRNGTYKASVVAAKKCGADCTKPCCDKTKKSCCASKKKACSAEAKAKCEAAKKSCDKASKACCKKDEKACSAEQKAKCEAAKKSCDKTSKACCAKKVEKSCGADCTKPCCAKADEKKCGADCTKPCCAK